MADVALTPYDSTWPERFAREAVALESALAPVLGIEHVGSTAVPGLAGKPTIDIAVGLESLALGSSRTRRIEALGYHYGGTHGKPQHVYRKGDAVPWEYLVHVVERGGRMWRDYLRFRDHLRSLIRRTRVVTRRSRPRSSSGGVAGTAARTSKRSSRPSSRAHHLDACDDHLEPVRTTLVLIQHKL